MIHGPCARRNPNSPYTTNGKFGLKVIQNHLRKKIQWMLMVILCMKEQTTLARVMKR
jgi:hypothetical protein